MTEIIKEEQISGKWNIPISLNAKLYSKHETTTPSPAGFTENLHTCATLRVVFSVKVLAYSFFP